MTAAVTSARSCTRYRSGRGVCGGRPATRFVNETLCRRHAPAYPRPDPARSLAALLERAEARRHAGRPVRFYDGSPGRELVICPDCGEPADAMFGSHLGADCYSRFDAAGRIRTDLEPGQYRLACMAIERAARRRAVFSSNNTRIFMDAKHIPVKVRQRAFRDLIGTVMEPLDYEDSNEVQHRRGVKPRRVRTYRSLIHQPAAAVVDQADLLVTR